MNIVLDASIALAWCFEEENAPDIQTLMLKMETDQPLVPAIWPLEVGNCLVQAERKGRISEGDSIRFVQLLEGLSTDVDSLTPHHALHLTLTLARSEKLTTYDAAYLELALRHHCPLATLDRPLRAIARKLGLTVLPEDL